MKKTVAIIFSYSILALIVCICLSFSIKNVPPLLPGNSTAYLFRRGILFFCRFVPAIAFCGFLIGCSVSYRDDAKKAKMRFSHCILVHFQKTMATSILLVFFISLSSHVLVPVIEQKQSTAKTKPILFSEFMSISRDSFEKGNMNLAYEYAFNALLIKPNDEEATFIKEHSEAALQSLKIIEDENTEEKIDFSHTKSAKTELETVSSLLKKAESALAEEEWFEAHYYAYRAIEIADAKDIQFEDAKRMASEAWNHLFDTTLIMDSETSIFFKKKRDAYKNLINGDSTEAYYQFLELAASSEKAARNPDVAQFLHIAEERVKSHCFFIEEVENLRRFETYRNVYFSLMHEDGTKDVIYIRGITPVFNSGKMVQYLRGFTLFTYSEEGTFERSLFVPYAKLLSERTDSFDANTKAQFGIKDDFKTVPYLMLKSISKNTRGISIYPVYEYNPEYTKKNVPYLDNYFILGMPMNDFNLLCETYPGAEKMNLLSLMRIFSRIGDYGYSSEIYRAEFLYRITYPLILLVFFIFLAGFAWNYRLSETQLFKFKWIILIPFITILLHFVWELILYLFKLLDYIFVAGIESAAILPVIGIPVLFLFCASYIFVSRKCD